MTTFSVPQNVIANSSVTRQPSVVSHPGCEPFSPSQWAATVTDTIVPHMKTSPWAKLISSMMP